MTPILAASVVLIVLAIIVPKPGRSARQQRARTDYLLDQAAAAARRQKDL